MVTYVAAYCGCKDRDRKKSDKRCDGYARPAWCI